MQNSAPSVRLFSEGQEFTHSFKITEESMRDFSALSGDENALHVDPKYARSVGFQGRVAYGNLLGAATSYLVGMKLATPRVMLARQQLDFKLPVYVGQTIRLSARVVRIQEALGVIELGLTFRNDEEALVSKGSCLVKCL